MRQKFLSYVLIVTSFAAVAAPSSLQGFYVVGSIGKNATNWVELMPDNIVNDSVIKNGYSGFSYGGKLGFNFNKNLAVEVSFFELAGLKKDSKISAGYSRQDHWFVAGVVKFSPDWLQFNQVKPYFDAGLSYRKIVESGYVGGIIIDVGALSTVRPLFGMGVDFKFNDNWFLNLDYTYNQSFYDNSVFAPSARLLTIGLGYKL